MQLFGTTSLKLRKRKSGTDLQDSENWFWSNVQWHIDAFGLSELQRYNIIHLNENHLPTFFNNEERDFKHALADLSDILNLGHLEIELVHTDDDTRLPTRLQIVAIDGHKKYTIYVHEEILGDTGFTLTCLCIDMIKIRLSEFDLIIDEKEEASDFLFLAMVFHGFGVVALEHLREEKFNNKLVGCDDMMVYYSLIVFFDLFPDKRELLLNILNTDEESKYNKYYKTVMSEHLAEFENLQNLDRALKSLKEAWDLYDQGFMDLAISMAQEALTGDPRNCNILNSVGFFMLRKEEFKESIVYFQRALDEDPYYAPALNNYGLALVHLRRTKEGKEKIDAALKLDKYNPMIHRNLGIALAHLGKKEQSLKSFQRAAQINPDAELLLYYKALALLQFKNDKEAVLLLRDASMKDVPEVQALLAKIDR